MKVVHAVSGEEHDVNAVECPKEVISRLWGLPEDDLILLTARGTKVDIPVESQWILFFQKSLLGKTVELPLFFPLRIRTIRDGSSSKSSDVVSLEELHAIFPRRFRLQCRAIQAVKDNLFTYREKLSASLEAFKRLIGRWQMRFNKCRDSLDADLMALQGVSLHPALELRQNSLADLIPIERIKQFADSVQDEIPLLWSDVDKVYEKLELVTANAQQVWERLSILSVDELTCESREKLGRALRDTDGDATVISCELQQRWSERCRVFLQLLREVALSQAEMKHLFSRGLHLEEQVNSLKNRASQLEHVGLLHEAYGEALVEIQRRRNFRDASLKIAREATLKLQKLEVEENAKREHFATKYGHHLPSGFLSAVTQGSRVVPVKFFVQDSWDDVLPVLGGLDDATDGSSHSSTPPKSEKLEDDLV